MNVAYRILRGFTKFWINRFFRHIEIKGAENIPAGSAVFAMNHPNNLIDTLLVSYAIPRKIYFLATARLFRNRVLSMLLHNVGVVPIYRKQDDPEYEKKNIGAFENCYRILAGGEAIGIYPEGTTHAEPRVRRIKTGTARIALEAERRFHPGIQIIPVGLNFSVRKSFREEVVINIGKGMDVAEYLDMYEKDGFSAVDRLTADLQHSLEQEVIHIDEPVLDEMVKEIEDIYKGELIRDLMQDAGVPSGQIDSFRLSKKLVDGIHYFNQNNPAFLRVLREDIRIYRSRLQRVHLQDALLRRITTNPATYRTFSWHVIWLAVGFLPALLGMIQHFAPHQLTKRISRATAKKETDYATTKILWGILIYPIFYVALIFAVRFYFGWFAATIYGLTLPMFGAFAYYYLDRCQKFGEDVQLFFVKITRKKLIQQLKQRRENLIQKMDQAKEEFLNASLQA